MNKLFFTIGLCCLVASYVSAAPNTEKHGKDQKVEFNKELRENIESEIKSYIATLTRDIIRDITEVLGETKDKCPDIEEKLTGTVDEVTECVLGIDIGLNTICGALKSTINKCSKPVLDVVSECLPKESRDIPLLLEKTIIGFFDQACHLTVEEVLELFNPCQYELNWSEVKSCETLMKTVEEYDDKLPSTKSICGLIASTKKCSDDIHDLSCTNQVSKNIFGKFHKSIEQETEAVCHANEI